MSEFLEQSLMVHSRNSTEQSRQKNSEYFSVINEQSFLRTEPVFVNVYGAQESIPMDRFRQPM
jgi:hypothetical protein